MKTVGILGGIGPESTIEYYRLIIEGYRRQRNDGSSPAILLTSLDVQKLLALMNHDNLPGVVDYLVPEIDRLARAGADFAFIAANTPHIVFDELQQRTAIPLVSIVEASCAEMKTRGIKRAGLLGTRFTMQAHFYQDVSSREGIALLVPDKDERTYIHDKYVNELLNNIFLPATRERLLAIIDGMRQRDQVEAILLAGTELPLILHQEQAPGTPLLDTTRIHSDAIVTQLVQ